MNTKKWFTLLLFIGFFFEAGMELQGQFYFSTRDVTRGADTAEIYINCPWYEDSNGVLWNGLFRSTDNGQTLTVKRKGVLFLGEGGLIFGDSIAGRIFQLPTHLSTDTLGISFDYGANFDFKFFNNIYYPAAGCMAGEIYIQASELGMGIYRSIDYGNTFTWQISDDSLELREVGTLPGELYCYNWTAMIGPLGLAYSNDFGHTFTTSYIEFPGLPVFDECMIYRGTEPGEIYFVIWKSSAEKYLLHTFDYGQSITFQSQIPPFFGEMTFTAGRTPGTFYIVDRVFVTHSELIIYFSRDYGITYTTYFHNLDSTYTEIPSISIPFEKVICYPNPVKDNLIVELPSNNREIEIQLFDFTGQMKLTIQVPVNQDKAPIDISSLKPGIYLLKMTDGESVIGVEKVGVK